MNGGRNLPAVITPCRHCTHAPHDMGVRCNAPVTSIIRDDVGYGAPPTYITRTLIVGTCGCTANGVWRAPIYQEMHQWVVAAQATTPADDTGHHPKGGAQHTPHVHDTHQVCDDKGLDQVYQGQLDDVYNAWRDVVYNQMVHARTPEQPRAICKHSGSTGCGRWSRCEYPTCTMTDDDDQ